MKAFKDFDISDFEVMGSIAKLTGKTPSKHRPFFGFNKTKKGKVITPYKNYSVSNLDDVL